MFAYCYFYILFPPWWFAVCNFHLFILIYSFFSCVMSMISTSEGLFISHISIWFFLVASVFLWNSPTALTCSTCFSTFNTLIIVISNFLSVPTPGSYLSVSFLLCIYNWQCTLAGVAQWIELPACEPKGHQFNSQSRAYAWVVGQVPSRGRAKATMHWCFSPFLFPSLPLCLKINEILKKKHIKLEVCVPIFLVS